jgi:hypothetical protein
MEAAKKIPHSIKRLRSNYTVKIDQGSTPHNQIIINSGIKLN